MKNIDVINLDNCIVKDETGLPLAKLTERAGRVLVTQLPGCSIGTYFYILEYLKELGWEVE